MRSRALEPAFQATTYRVETDDGVFNLRVGVANEAFDRYLHRHAVCCWAVLTACNPGAVCSDENNLLRHAKLLERVESSGYRHFPACNLADDDAWPAEPGLLLLQIDEMQVAGLAAEFSQLAFVFGNAGNTPRLVWL